MNTKKLPGGGGLRCFGALDLEYPLARVTSKHLLLLSYVTLEGVSSRQELAHLFWSHLAGSYTQKGERKDLANLGVARAVLKRELGVDIEEGSQLAHLNCDVKQFETLVAEGDFETALTLYSRGVFLAGIEDQPRLNLSAELYAWLEQKRTQVSTLASDALTRLARQPEGKHQALACAEEVFHLSRESRDLDVQERLYKVLSQLDSPLALEAKELLTTLINERLETVSSDALILYLAFSLQETGNLAAAQIAADISPSAGAACVHELREAALINAHNRVVNDEVARTYLEQHPKKKLRLLGRLRDHTPTEQAHTIYRAIYAVTQTFGGMGYWQQARAAYIHKATAFIEEGTFQKAAKVLGELQEAEHHAQQTPDSESRFLQAYALERLSHYQQGLSVLEGVAETPDIVAIRAALLARTANFQEAKVLAQRAKESGATSSRQFWVKAIALNTLGQVAYEENNLLEAEVCFTQAALQWALAGHPQRELGALMNRANSLEKLRRKNEARQVYEEVLAKCAHGDVLRVRTLLNVGHLFEDLGEWQQAYDYYGQAHALCEAQQLEERDTALAAAVHNNLGYTQWHLGLEAARTHLICAMTLALRAGEHLLYAVALGNLALVERDLAKLAAALELLEQLGSRELAHYRERYEQMLQARIEAAKKAEDVKSLQFLEGTFASFLESEM